MDPVKFAMEAYGVSWYMCDCMVHPILAPMMFGMHRCGRCRTLPEIIPSCLNKEDAKQYFREINNKEPMND